MCDFLVVNDDFLTFLVQLRDEARTESRRVGLFIRCWRRKREEEREREGGGGKERGFDLDIRF